MRKLESPFLPYADQDYQVDRAMLREPKLWMPGQQPTGPVRIDWSNPLTKRLKTAAIATSYGAIDVGRAVPATRSGTAVKVNSDGHYVEGTSASSYATFPDVKNGLHFTSATPFSIVVRLRNSATAANQYLCAQRGPDYLGTWRIQVYSSGFIYFASYTTSAQWAFSNPLSPSSSTFPMNEFFTLGISTTGGSGDTIFVYRNGALVDSSNTLLTDVLLNAINNDLSFYGETRDMAGISPGSGMEFLYLFESAALSAEEHASIAADPYQFLVPA